MPTENRSSTIEQHDHIEVVLGMVSVPAAHDLASKVREAMDRQACPNAWMIIAYEAVLKNFPAQVPQPHAEPIAWMVGTAFWWTKEEAERDAAAMGLPVVTLGPCAGLGDHERLRTELVESDLAFVRAATEAEQLRAQLAERDALLRELADAPPAAMEFRLQQKVKAVLSVSAEPEARP